MENSKYKYHLNQRVQDSNGTFATILERFMDGQVGDEYPSYTVKLDIPAKCDECNPPCIVSIVHWVEEAIVKVYDNPNKFDKS